MTWPNINFTPGKFDGAIKFADSAAVDAFGRMRVSNPTTIWDSQFEYNLHPIYYEAVTDTNGTISHNAAHSSADLNVTTDNGSTAILQSREYFRYQPGKSQQVVMTFLMAAATTGLDQRVGQFDVDNGFFLEQTGSTVNMVRRTKTSGSVVNNKTAQAAWNIDVMDGTGPSGDTLDLTKVQILHIDYQWLSTGRIRYGFDIDGVIRYAHEELVANTLAVPSTTTANLPVRWELDTTQAIAGARTMEAICVSVTSEGGQELQTGHVFEFGREGQTAADNTEELLIGIRPATTLNSITYRGKIVPLRMTLLVSGATCRWRLRYLVIGDFTGASWQAPVQHSGVETDIASTAVSGGTVIDGGFMAAGQGNRFEGGTISILQRYPLTLDADGTQRLALALTAEGVGGTATVHSSLSWEEIR